MLRRLAIAAIAAAGLAAVPATTAQAIESPGCIVRTSPPAIGVKELKREATNNGRLLEINLASKANQSEQPLLVQLPKGYDADPNKRWPVLYLLHGAFGNYKHYVEDGFDKVIDDAPYIVVMPDDGPNGGYSDWYGVVAGTTKPIPSWETFHLKELLPWIDANFRTQPDAAHRFIAGISSGGSGTMKYAAANPGLFGAAGEFSGAVDITLDYPRYPTISEALWLLTLIPGLDPAGHCTWGDPYTQRVIWEDNNPTYLAENLKGTSLFLATGDGNPGPDDSYYDPVEGEVYAMNQAFAKRLDEAGIAHTDRFYGAGTHSAPYWRRELALFLEWLAPRVGQAKQAGRFNMRSMRTDFTSWGWRFQRNDRVRGTRSFTYVRGISKRGFDVAGSGRLTVTTPGVYRPGERFSVSGERVRADREGRLRFEVDLGPSHTEQQTEFGPEATDGWVHKEVRITR